MLGEPKYYELISNVVVLKKLFYPTIFADSHLIMYRSSDLTDPAITPICQYYYSGIRRFILNDEEYSSMDIDKYQLNVRALLLYKDGVISNEYYNSIKNWMGHSDDDNKYNFNVRDLNIFNSLDRASKDIKTICVYKLIDH